MAPTFVDLFCGIGGFRIGLEAAGFECVYANDIDDHAVETYKRNRSPDATYPVECADIRDVFHHRLGNIPRHDGRFSRHPEFEMDMVSPKSSFLAIPYEHAPRTNGPIS